MKLLRGALAALTAVYVVGTARALGATVKVGFPYDEVVEGTIQSGDADKLRAYIAANDVSSVYLSSPGGDLGEAMKMGRLIRSLYLETTVPGKNPSDLKAAVAKRHHIDGPRFAGKMKLMPDGK